MTIGELMTIKTADPSIAAVVTGSATGLGRRISEELVEWGCDVFGLDIVEQEAFKGNGRFHPVTCDVTSATEVTSAAEYVSNRSDNLRFVIANAGRYPNRALAEWTFEEFEDLWRLNVGGTFNVMQKFVPLLGLTDWSRLVVVSSNAALLGVPGFVPYAATKSALLGMVRSLAAEVAGVNMTVNAIAPGLTQTSMAISDSSEVAPFFVPVREGQLVKRTIEPEDVLSTLRYVCDRTSAMITGQTLIVDGGTVLK